jgi:Recombination directionality factor-like
VTTLVVVLPTLPDVGVWRLRTGGWFAATELPRTVELLLDLMQTHGRMPQATLGIEGRTRKSNGQTYHFPVPVLRVPYALAELGAPDSGPDDEPAPELPGEEAPIREDGDGLISPAVSSSREDLTEPGEEPSEGSLGGAPSETTQAPGSVTHRHKLKRSHAVGMEGQWYCTVSGCTYVTDTPVRREGVKRAAS